MISSAYAIFVTGHSVYYKSKGDAKQKGPGYEIGQDGQQVLVKHGSIYVCVRLMLESGGDNIVKNRGSSTIGDDTVNNLGRSTVIKTETDASRPKFNGATGPAHVYSDESDAQIDTITTRELPGQPNLSADPRLTDSPIKSATVKSSHK